MSKWPMVRLGDVCRPKQWKTISSSELLPEGYPVYGANGIIGYYHEYNHEEETILITCRGATCGTVNICSKRSYVTGNAMALDNLNTQFDIGFLASFLKFRGFDDVISGTAQPQIVRVNIEKVSVPLPPQETQRQISATLDAAAQLLALRRQKLAHLDALIQSVFYDMFGDLETNQYGWSLCPIANVAKIDTKMIHDFEGYEEYPHIGIDSIERETGIISGFRTVKEDGVISGKYLFSPEHIIYSKIRPNLNKVAIPDFHGLCSADAYPILPLRNVCSKYYLAYVLRSQVFLKYILGFSGRTNIPKVNKQQIAGFQIPHPPFSLQTRFASIVQDIEAQKALVRHSITESQTLFDSLMAGYFAPA